MDEANASLGVARLYATEEMDRLLFHIQNDLFDVGADLCVPEDEENKERLRLHPHQVTFLEEKIDYYNKSIPPLHVFCPSGRITLIRISSSSTNDCTKS